MAATIVVRIDFSATNIEYASHSRLRVKPANQRRMRRWKTNSSIPVSGTDDNLSIQCYNIRNSFTKSFVDDVISIDHIA